MKSTQYSEKTLDHFRNPRNVGTLEGDDVAVGRVGNPVCGDLMEMYVRVKDDRIEDIKFQTFGCGSAVATSSMITELVMGKTLDEALEVTRADVADALDGLPPVKMHCSNLAADALHDAIKNWRSGTRLKPLGAEEIAAAGEGCGTREVDGHPGSRRSTPARESTPPSTTSRSSPTNACSWSTKESLRPVWPSRSPRSPLGSSSSPSLRHWASPRRWRREVKRSDVKVLFRSRLLAVRGEGEVEKVLIRDLDEDDEYELFVDAVVLLGS